MVRVATQTSALIKNAENLGVGDLLKSGVSRVKNAIRLAKLGGGLHTSKDNCGNIENSNNNDNVNRSNEMNNSKRSTSSKNTSDIGIELSGLSRVGKGDSADDMDDDADETTPLCDRTRRRSLERYFPSCNPNPNSLSYNPNPNRRTEALSGIVIELDSPVPSPTKAPLTVTETKVTETKALTLRNPHTPTTPIHPIHPLHP